MKEEIKEKELRKASNIERCRMILEIIKRTSSIQKKREEL